MNPLYPLGDRDMVSRNPKSFSCTYYKRKEVGKEKWKKEEKGQKEGREKKGRKTKERKRVKERVKKNTSKIWKENYKTEINTYLSLLRIIFENFGIHKYFLYT